MASSSDRVNFSFSAITLAAWEMEMLDQRAEQVERELAANRRKRRAESGVLRFITTLIAASLMTMAGAAAAHGAASPTASASSSAPTPDYTAQTMAAVAPMMPEGMRASGITLGCKPPADATLKAVAPGLTRIQSRGFVVEFTAGLRTIVCSASLDAQRQMLVAAHDIQPGDAVSDADFKTQWVDAFSSGTGSLGAFPQTGPYAATTLIRAGDPLYQNQIARPIAVHAGDLVMVLVKNGPVVVRTELQSQSTVAVGETATVVNPTSGIPLMVTITGPKTAELVMQ